MSATLDSPLLPRRDRFWTLVSSSAAVHVALIAAGLVLRPPPLIDLEQKPIVAKLVRLGEKRPEHLLPRKEEPPPSAGEPEAPPAPALPDPQAARAPAPQPRPPAPKPTAAPARGKPGAMASALDRLKREPLRGASAGGDPSGDPLGDASEGEAGDRYLALVQRSIHEVYRLPSTISERDRLHLRAQIRLFLAQDGKMVGWSFVSRSGSAAYDDALGRALQQARFPPPPTDLRHEVQTNGLLVRFSI